MADSPDPRDLELLGLEPGATLRDLRRAFRRARATWSEESLATYGLVDTAERDAILERLTAAYERLAGSLDPGSRPGSREGGLPTGPSPGKTPAAAIAAGESASSDPAALLRATRIASGISLDTVARETRIRRTILEALEEVRTAALPAPVYVRGFVIAYAEVLALEDPEDLARRYLEMLEERAG